MSQDGLREQRGEPWVAASCSSSSSLGAGKRGWDEALGSGWAGGGMWVYLGVSRRESLIALGGWPD